MQLTSSIILAAVLLASESFALAGSGSPGTHGADGKELTARMRRHHHKKRSSTCKVKSSSNATVAVNAKYKASSTSSAAASTATASSSSSSNSTGLPSGQTTKLGLSWTYGNVMDVSKYTDLGASWYYTWDSTTHGATTSASFYPMLWGASSSNITAFKANVNADPSKITSKTVMAFNEPDIAGQSNVDVATACSVIEEVLLPLKEQYGFKIIGPAPADAMGSWYKKFAAQCPDTEAKLDYSALHFYNTDPTEVIANIKTFYSTYNKPIYITETACWSYTSEAQCTGLTQATNYLTTIGKFVQETDWMVGFAPFGFFQGTLPGNVGSFDALSSSSGAPTALFEAVASATINGS